MTKNIEQALFPRTSASSAKRCTEAGARRVAPRPSRGNKWIHRKFNCHNIATKTYHLIEPHTVPICHHKSVLRLSQNIEKNRCFPNTARSSGSTFTPLDRWRSAKVNFPELQFREISADQTLSVSVVSNGSHTYPKITDISSVSF